MAAGWFVKTRGRSVREDYRWYPVGAGDPADADEIANRGYRGRPWYTLIDDQKPGMLLFDDPQYGTVLVISGLVSDDHPRDYQNRLIRATLLGSASPGNDAGQRELIGVAVAALRDALASSVPVSYGTTRGVEVNAPAWARFARMAASELKDYPELELAEESKRGHDDVATRRRAADSVSALYARKGPDSLSDSLLIVWTPLVSQKDVAPLRPWRVIGEVASSSQDGKINWGKLIDDIAHDPVKAVDAGAKVIEAGAKAAAETRRKVTRWVSGGLVGLVIIAVAIYLITDNSSSPSGWRATSTVSANANGAAPGGIVPLSTSEALGAWVNPASRQLSVEHWDNGAWSPVSLPQGLPDSPYASVTVGVGSGADAWIFASSTVGGHSYALHWIADTLSGPIGDLPGSLVVTASEGGYAIGTVQVTVESHSSSTSATSASESAGKPPTKPKPKSSVQQETEHVLVRWTGTAWRQTRIPAPPAPAGGTSPTISGIAVVGSQAWMTATAVTASGTRLSALVKLVGTQWVYVTSPASPRGTYFGKGTYAIAPDGTGGLWLGSDAGARLYDLKKGYWTISQVAADNRQSVRVVGLAWRPEAKSMVGLGTIGSSPERAILNFAT